MTPVGLATRLDDLQRDHPVLGYPLAVLYKYIDDQGGYLAALVAYYGFISLFPLLLLLTTVLGLVLQDDPKLQQDVLKTALAQIPAVGNDVTTGRLGGGVAGLVVGLLGATYGGLGVAQAVQNAMNTAWRVPRNSRPNPLKVRLRSLQLLLVVGLVLVGTTAMSAFSASGVLGVGLRVLTFAGVFVLNAAAFVFAFRRGTTRPLSVRDVLPGAVAAAVLLQLLQVGGKAYANHVVKNATVTSGVFATVLGLIAFLYLASTAFVLCVQANAVLVDRLYPRALLTPFTDSVDLTPGDRRAYAEQAMAQRAKGFQEVDVHFGPPPQDVKADGEQLELTETPGSGRSDA